MKGHGVVAMTTLEAKKKKIKNNFVKYRGGLEPEKKKFYIN